MTSNNNKHPLPLSLSLFSSAGTMATNAQDTLQQRREGWVIVDDRGRRWGEDLYSTKEAAERTASACVASSYTIKRAFRVSHFRPSTSTTGRFVGEWKIED